MEDDPQERADELGLHLVEAKPNILQLDLDSVEAIKTFEAQFQIFKNLWAASALGAVGVLKTHSRSSTRENPRQHVHIRLEHEVDVFQRQALQAMLGSDRKRELLSLFRELTELEQPRLVLFETEEEIHRVREFYDDPNVGSF